VVGLASYLPSTPTLEVELEIKEGKKKSTEQEEEKGGIPTTERTKGS
jgi:hypothetical protein